MEGANDGPWLGTRRRILGKTFKSRDAKLEVDQDQDRQDWD